jgi:hypothetical protein
LNTSVLYGSKNKNRPKIAKILKMSVKCQYYVTLLCQNAVINGQNDIFEFDLF